MKSQLPNRRACLRAFISMQAAIMIAIITGGALLLAYEWHSAHPAKSHHSSGGSHHKKDHEPKQVAHNNN